MGSDQPGVGRAQRAPAFRRVGDLTVLADGRLVLVSDEGDVADLADALAALVGEEPDRVPSGRGDRHIGRVRLALEVLDRHRGLGG